MMEKLLLITPPFVQVNCPYPATAYLKGYLQRRGYAVSQYDLSIELIGALFTPEFLSQVFDAAQSFEEENVQQLYALRERYLRTIEPVMDFLRGKDPTLANRICNSDFLPQGTRFEQMDDLDEIFGPLGLSECARYLCTLYLQDLSDLLRSVVSEHFEIVRYGERIALSIESFAKIEAEILTPPNAIEQRMIELLEAQIQQENPTLVGFTIPFPGTLPSALRCARHLREQHPQIRILLGGGYPATELRSMSDRGIFRYIDYLILDDGEVPLERILSGGDLVHTYTREGYHEGEGRITHLERGCPDFEGLPFDRYLSLIEVNNPMHRLWSDGRWNKMMLAHGCYWAKCAFCDTSLDYIGRYESVPAATLVDWMEQVMAQTGSRGFHFVDEAAPPRLLRDLSIEILRRGLSVTWWTNLRFERSYTEDLCLLMAEAGCIAVSGGLEVASDRLLASMHKGVTITQAATVMRNLNRAGILTHTYLMYGFPTQTLQESIDALEVVRQLFQAEWIASAFWHRYAMTVHSPSGCYPQEYGVKRRNAHVHTFANNEVAFVENRGYNIAQVGEALNEALANYMYGCGLDRPVHKWFAGKAQPTSLRPTLIEELEIAPDEARLFRPEGRIVWIGATLPTRTPDGLLLRSASESRTLQLPASDADFLMRLLPLAADLSHPLTMNEASALYT
ncbi:MAG: radical SAM protein, partial [Alistipes sp.]|nr:radical SAM protein [Alistipes sp.]